MIGSFTYEQILEYAKQLKECYEIIDDLAKKQEGGMLQPFISNVERYSTFLKSSIEIYQDADKVLEPLRNQK